MQSATESERQGHGVAAAISKQASRGRACRVRIFYKIFHLKKKIQKFCLQKNLSLRVGAAISKQASKGLACRVRTIYKKFCLKKKDSKTKFFKNDKFKSCWCNQQASKRFAQAESEQRRHPRTFVLTFFKFGNWAGGLVC